MLVKDPKAQDFVGEFLMILSTVSSETCIKGVIFRGSEGGLTSFSVIELTEVSLIFFILFEKRRQTNQLMTCQTCGMEVPLQIPCSGFFAQLMPYFFRVVTIV